MTFMMNIEELMKKFDTQKTTLVRHLIKNYKENTHYIIDNECKNVTSRGGSNRIDYFLTEDCFEWISNSYNMRNVYTQNIGNNIKQVNIAMCIENSTIGFITNSFKEIAEMKRQQAIGKYKVDLYFPEYKLIVECDENGHSDRDIDDERIREEFLIALGNKMIRFNPSDNNFDLSNVLREINTFIFGSRKN